MKSITGYLQQKEIDRIIEMAWEDRTPFEAIQFQFGLGESEVIQLMRENISRSSWKNWRKRVQGRPSKHSKLRSFSVGRFKSQNQRP